MKVIRTFVAVLIDEELRQNIAEVQSRVKKLAPDVKWVAPENFHVTLKFLGDVEEDALSQVFTAVEEAARRCSPFDLSMSGLGAFPNPSRARVVWAGISDGRDKVSDLASKVDESLSKLGFGKEDKPFKAHITIGRVKDSRNLGRLAEAIQNTNAVNLGTQRVNSVAVMQSEMLRSGSIYTPLRIIDLSGGG
ncbi:MAG: RNA 2',3'-cyclic phosphodiesterase [Armatimonadota bacterium]|nr:RNA 2',3'-cyclic phosphodiesterase [bacterium]